MQISLNNRKGVSPVIATVLLILIVLVLIGILALFLLPGFTKQAQERAACVEAIDKINFGDLSFNCYYESDGKSRTGFSVRINSDKIVGFRLGLINEGSSDTIDLIDGSSNSKLRMLNQQTFGEPLEVVTDGGVRTYVADEKYSRIDIFPILSFEGNHVCESTRKSLGVAQCLDVTLEDNIDDETCGNNEVDGNEQCDDGNKDNTDSCTNSCKDARCGDNDIWKDHEECDDGNDNNNDACTNSCKIAICGDDICAVDEQDQCGDDCSEGNLCELTGAHWKKTDAVEGELVGLVLEGTNCGGQTVSFSVKEDDLVGDDAVVNEPGSVTFAQDALSVTGVWKAEWQDDVDGFGNPPEYYFNASLFSDPNEKISSSTDVANELKVFLCGNGKVNGDQGETCDDGNLNNGDGCSQSCNVEDGWGCIGEPSECTQPSCGDNMCNNGETCDTCSQDCGVCGPSCGDGTCNNGETCSTCSDDCGVCGPSCGDNVCNNGETCDTCAGDCGVCELECGNGIWEPSNGELCDDGNNVNGDGCTECMVDGNEDDGGDWFCSGSIGEQSLCCNRQTGECSDEDNDDNPGNGYYDWQEQEEGCEGPGSLSCSATFGGLFGWLGDDSSQCSLNLQLCTVWQDYCPENPDCPYDGYVYGHSTKTCCYERGICQVFWNECVCQGA